MSSTMQNSGGSLQQQRLDGAVAEGTLSGPRYDVHSDWVGVKKTAAEQANGLGIAGTDQPGYDYPPVVPDVRDAVPNGPGYARGGDTTSGLFGVSPADRGGIDGESTPSEEGFNAASGSSQVVYSAPALAVEARVSVNQSNPVISSMPVSIELAGLNGESKAPVIQTLPIRRLNTHYEFKEIVVNTVYLKNRIGDPTYLVFHADVRELVASFAYFTGNQLYSLSIHHNVRDFKRPAVREKRRLLASH
ncbi:hypothetical protein C8R43DRAFT_952162, partial [Mycena crocata]